MKQILPVELDGMFISIKNEVVTLNLRWGYFKQLFCDTDQKMELLNKSAPFFFKQVLEVFRNDVFMVISRLTDKPRPKSKENFSLVYLRDMLATPCEVIFMTLLDEKLQEILKNSSGIRFWRDKRIAHIDLSTVINFNKEILPGVTRGQVDELIIQINEFIKIIDQHYEILSLSFKGEIINDANSLVKLIERAAKK